MRVKISDRDLMKNLLNEKLNLSQELHNPLFHLIDKVDKISADKFQEELSIIGLTSTQISDLNKLLEIKDFTISERLTKIFEVLEINGVADYCEIDLKIIRGFDYYTHTVFEAWANTSLRRALFGGGRYDNLTMQIGGKKKLPGVGFAVGDMTIIEILNDLKKYPQINANESTILITLFNEEMKKTAIEVASILRKNNIKTELYLSEKKMKKQFSYADKKNIPFVIVIGEDEKAQNKVLLKNLKDGNQEVLSIEEVIAKFK